MPATATTHAHSYANMCSKYPVVTIEDPFDQNDWENWCAGVVHCGGGAHRLRDTGLFVAVV